MATLHKRKRLLDAYGFTGFRALELVRSVSGDSWAQVGTVVRRSRKTSGSVPSRVIMSTSPDTTAQPTSARSLHNDARVHLEFEIRRMLCRSCGKVTRERLDFLADIPFYTKRFAWFVGPRCSDSTINDVAQELKLNWQTLKELDEQYMLVRLAKAGTPCPKAIGVDEISIRKGHTYRIVVSDLIRRRAIWFDGMGPFASEHGVVLRVARPEEDQRWFA